jgi:Arc/MetJ-type ribon-helix-helix transcriptional regulator
MLSCFDLSKDNKNRIEDLIDRERYDSPDEVINAGIEMLYRLDQQVQESGGFFLIGDEPGPSSDQTLNSNTGRSSGEETLDSAVMQRYGRQEGKQEVKIPDIFRAKSLKDESIMKEKLRSSEEPDFRSSYSPNEWVFGQYNRYLPLKASCRAIAHLTIEWGPPLEVERAAESISRDALRLGEYLDRIDEERDLKRDQRLATAFPKPGSGEEKSRQRYANQFVAEVSKSGEYRGMPDSYQLIVPADSSHLWLSETGWTFARLPNPILDSDEVNRGDPERLAQDEKEWLIQHIRERVPREEYAFRMILEALDQEVNTPGDIDAFLRAEVPGVESVSDSYLTSQRSGAISRMADLSLVHRVRMGNRVKYEATEAGRDLFSSM